MDFGNIAAASREGNSRPAVKEKEVETEIVLDDESDSTIDVAVDEVIQDEVKEAKPAIKTDDSPLAENELLKKRLHDNQAAYHKANQELLNARKENELLKAAKSDKPTGEESEWFAPDGEDLDKKPVETDPKHADLEKKVSDLERQAWQDKWDMAAEPVRAKYADYNMIVEEVLGSEFETNAELQKRFQEKGATPEAAYELGRELYFLRNPEKLREQIRAEEAAKLNNLDDEPDNKDISLVLSANSKPPGSVSIARNVSRAQSVINRVLSS